EHMSLALTLVADYDWRNGLKEFDRALELNPNLAFAYELQAWTVNGLGRFDEAIARTRKAVELDPLNPFFQMSLSFYQYWARQYDDAIAQATKTLEIDPNSAISHVLLGLSFLKKGDTAGAIAELEKSKAPDPGAWYQGSSVTRMLFLEIERKPRRPCANSNNWRNGNTSVQQRSRR